MVNTLHFKSPHRQGRTLCGRRLQGRNWTTDGDEFNPVVKPDEAYMGRCMSCRRSLEWMVRPSGKGLYLGCPTQKVR